MSQSSSRPSTLIEYDRPLSNLLELVKEEDALENATSNLWERVWTILKRSTSSDIDIQHQQPPCPYAHQRVKGRTVKTRNMRRVDAIIVGYDRTGKAAYIPIIIAEYKRPRISGNELETLEAQVNQACNEYVRSPDTATNLCYGAAIFGAKIRLFRCADDMYGPVWGKYTDCDVTEYKDISKPEGWYVFDMFLKIINTTVPLLGKPAVPSTNTRSTPVIGSNTEAVPTPVTAVKDMLLTALRTMSNRDAANDVTQQLEAKGMSRADAVELLTRAGRQIQGERNT